MVNVLFPLKLLLAVAAASSKLSAAAVAAAAAALVAAEAKAAEAATAGAAGNTIKAELRKNPIQHGFVNNSMYAHYLQLHIDLACKTKGIKRSMK